MTIDPSHQEAERILNELLTEFGIPNTSGSYGPRVRFAGAIPPPSQTQSTKLCMSLVGSIPALACAATAAQIWEARGGSRQDIEVDLRRGHNYIDPDIGMTPSLNGQEITVDLLFGNPFINNIFETRDHRWAVLSAVYVDLVYKWTALLECSVAEGSVRAAVESWNAADLEALAAEAGLPMAICQTEQDWKVHSQGSVMAQQAIVPVREATSSKTSQVQLSVDLSPNPERPLSGLKVICLTHAIAGPSAGRTLAEHGASVLQVMFTHGFEHNFVYTYANLGTASTRLNLHTASDKERLWTLVREAHVWIDSYRDGAIDKFGFSNDRIRQQNPGIIISHTRCYGTSGPWASKPGFDMQGSASSGMMCFMGENLGDGRPQWPPGMVINDYTTGYFTALAILGVFLRRFKGEVTWEQGFDVSPSLCGTAMAILRLFKTKDLHVPHGEDDKAATTAENALPPRILEGQAPLGFLRTLAPLPQMSLTPITYDGELLVPMGSSKPIFPGYEDDSYDVMGKTPCSREEIAAQFGAAQAHKLEDLRLLGKSKRDEGEE